MLSIRDALLLALALFGSSLATAAAAIVGVTAPNTLLDLPLLVIVGACGASMLGGIVGTLIALHKAQQTGENIKSIGLLLGVNLGVAIVLGVATWAMSSSFGWSAETLLGLLVLVGVAGEMVLAPVLAALKRGAELLSSRFFEGPKA